MTRATSGLSRAGAALAAGGISGIDQLGRCLALATLLFAGPLAAAVVPALAMFCLMAVAGTLLSLSRRRSGPMTLAAVQLAPVAVLSPAIAAVAERAASGAIPTGDALVTGMAILGTGTLACGAAMALFATFDLGRMVRMMPYPVTAGFMAASGALLVVAGARLALAPVSEVLSDAVSGIMSGVAPGVTSQAIPDGTDIATRASVGSVGSVGMWATPALALGLAVAMGLLGRWRAGFGPFLALLGIIALAFGALSVLGQDAEPARRALAAALGLAADAPPVPDADWRVVGWALPTGTAPGAVHWDMVSAAAPACVAAVLVGLAGLMLNIAGLEITQRAELPSRPILARSAALNLLSGIGGGAPVYVSATSTQVAQTMGGTSRLIPAALAAVLLAGAVAAPVVFWAVPVFVTAGLLLHLGRTMLWRWMVLPALRGRREDSAVTAAILVASLLAGIVWAVALGLVASVVLFALTYARLPVVRRSDTLATRRSAVDRGPADTALLDAQAHAVRTIALQGFLFFGTAHQVSAHLRALFAGPDAPRAVILDLRGVTGVDATVLSTFSRLDAMAAAAGARLTLAGCAPDLERLLDRWAGSDGGTDAPIPRLPDADSALEAAEERLLRTDAARRADPQDGIRSALRAARATPAQIDRLVALMARDTVPAGTRLITAGDPSGDVFILESGRLAVRTATGRRLRSFGPGAVVGELASYLGGPRTADVVAETDVVVFRARPAAIDAESRADPDLAAIWHRAMARVLADKLHRTTRMLGDGGG